MPENIILAAPLQWSGALRRKLAGAPQFASWLTANCGSAVTRQTVHAWYEDLVAEASGAAAHSADHDTTLARVSRPEADVPTPTPILRHVLRSLRERVFFTLIVRDIQGVAPLLEVVTAMTALADLAVAQAYRTATHELLPRHGMPMDPETGLPQEMLVLGMGKLGGRELNVSSDIDLIMLYAFDGTTDGPRPLSHQEFYARVVQRMIPLLADHDVGGHVFRCDLRLRPDGGSGALAWSLPALEKYLIHQAREWERYAWIKARVLPCKAFAGSRPTIHAERLEALRVPFVYRKYFDFDALAALRGVRERIRDDWERRALSRRGVDTVHNIKLGDGGIREIEFVIQLNQLIRGGRMPSLQQRGLHSALYKQEKAGVLPAETAQGIESAYFFLRRVEHMLQYREDEQTHLLPYDADQRAALANAVGMSPADFEATLIAHRQFVADAFKKAFRIAGVGGDESDSTSGVLDTIGTQEDGSRQDSSTSVQCMAAAGEPVQRLLASPRVQSLPAHSHQRLMQLLPAILDVAQGFPDPDLTIIRLTGLIEHIASRSAYLALLAEYPDTLARVARIVSASPWAAQYLMQYPLLLDSLIEWNSLMARPDFDALKQQLSAELDASVLPNGQPDVEQQMNLMRDLQHQVTFQLLAQDLAGILTVEELADHLSALADILLGETLHRVWSLVQPRAPARSPYPSAANINTLRDSAPAHPSHPSHLSHPSHPAHPKPSVHPTPSAHPAHPAYATQSAAGASNLLPPARLAVIAYGKLGGKELGYASDLDLVFLYDDPNDNAGDRYARLARRMTSWLSTLTSSGRLYDVDLRLRPDGDAGLIAVTIDAFEQYQARHAWTWEHQAITRARFVAGDPATGARFEAVRQHILLQERDPVALRSDVMTMRERISAGHPNHSTQFDIKHDRGGMVDLEFVIQFLVLGHARSHPVLLGNLGNIALLRLAAQAGLVPQAMAEDAAAAYRSYRRRQHALRLQGAARARVPGDELASERAAVHRLWNHVLGD